MRDSGQSIASRCLCGAASYALSRIPNFQSCVSRYRLYESGIAATLRLPGKCGIDCGGGRTLRGVRAGSSPLSRDVKGGNEPCAGRRRETCDDNQKTANTSDIRGATRTDLIGRIDMDDLKHGVSRRTLLQAGAGLAGAVVLPGGMVLPAWGANDPALCTWPAGSQGDTVNIGASVPRTGTYAVQGEDELKGMQLAIEHINEGNPLIKKLAPNVTKGVLGKNVNLVVTDSGAKPNDAVQAQQRFINDNKIVAMTGATSSAVAVALNKFAQREKVLYLVAISGSNDTTGMDCARYSFRQCFYGETAANAIGPVLVKTYGKGKKAAFMTPDYTYGHTVTKSVNDYLTKNGGWTQVTNQISPLGTSDFSQYLTNIANSGAEVIVNVNWGRDAVLSVQQAKQFGLTPKMKMVIPYQIPFLAKE